MPVSGSCTAFLTARGALLFTCYLAAVLARATSVPTGMIPTTGESKSLAVEESVSVSELLEPDEATEAQERPEPADYMLSEYDAKVRPVNSIPR